MDENPKSRHRWFRFSLRTLLLLVTVCSGLFGWLGMHVRHTREQWNAVRRIERLRCVVCYESKSPKWLLDLIGIDLFADVTSVYTFGENFFDVDFAQIRGFTHVKLLTLGDARITDDGLANLERLTELRYLSLDGTQISDAGLAHLEQLTKLRHLNLSNTQITDAGLVHLRGLTRLKDLDLRDTQVTDTGCDELQTALPNLQILR